MCASTAVLLSFASLACAAAAVADPYPVTVKSCERDVVFDRAPRRAVSNDVNLTEMMLALGLRNRMIGYTGISGWKTLTPPLREALDGLPELARRYPSVEVLMQAGADFYFAGWNYGMQVGGPVTPATLAPLGIAVYELTESCAHLNKRTAATLDDVYGDLRNLGKIFDVRDRADARIASMQRVVADVQDKIARASTSMRPRVFVYDSGEDKPLTAGALAMPSALIRAAGGDNVMDDVRQSWTRVGWESVVSRNPEAIVIVDYSDVTAAQKIDFLLAQPALKDVEAIKHRRFIVIPYDQATPGVGNAQAIETIARVLHPNAGI